MDVNTPAELHGSFVVPLVIAVGDLMISAWTGLFTCKTVLSQACVTECFSVCTFSSLQSAACFKRTSSRKVSPYAQRRVEKPVAVETGETNKWMAAHTFRKSLLVHSSQILSYLYTPGQSLCEVGVIVRCLVLESYKHCWMQPNSPHAEKTWGE